jgi:hypothetical protein
MDHPYSELDHYDYTQSDHYNTDPFLVTMSKVTKSKLINACTAFIILAHVKHSGSSNNYKAGLTGP